MQQSFLNKYAFFINAGLFQICWLACVVGSAYSLTWPAALSCLALAAFQLTGGRQHPSDLKLVLWAIAMGLVIETYWVASGTMTFTESFPVNGIAPLWIIILWIGFALTVNHSLKWMKKHIALPLIMGAFGGPMSYFAGLRFGAVEYHLDFWVVSAALALAWAASLLVLVKLADSEPTESIQAERAS